MKKESLLHNLKEQTFCRISASKYGVGVFAIKDIPMGTELFELCNDDYEEDIINLTEEELSSLDKNVQKFVKDFTVKNFGHYSFPARGLNSLSIHFFLNHSSEPNVTHRANLKNGKLGFLIPIAKRNIKMGEELFEDYRTLGYLKDVEEQFPFLKRT